MITKQSTMSVVEAKSHFDDMLRRVENDEAIMIEHDGEPKAVVISVDEYRRRMGSEPIEKTGRQDDEKPEWLRMVEETGRLFEKDLKGKRIDVDEIIHKMREERDEELLEGLR